MAWVGTPTKKSLGKNVVRITGIHLAASATGTIGLFGSGKDIELPASFPTTPDDSSLTLADVIMITFNHNEAGGTGNESRHIHVEKFGTIASNWYIRFTNDQNQDSSDIEIYIQFFHSIIR